MGYGSVGDGNGICDSIFSEQPENLLSDESDHGSSVFVCILSVYDGFGSTGEGRYRKVWDLVTSPEKSI